MSLETPEKPRKTVYEGPAELIQADVSLEDLNNQRGMVGGSRATWLTRKLGQQGTGWNVEPAAYEHENATKRELQNPINVAQGERWFRNNFIGDGKDQLKDGTDASALGPIDSGIQVEKYDLVKYPDGKVHEANGVENDAKG